jgi:hypothetical protein
MPTPLTDEQRQAIAAQPGVPLRVVDPQTNETYVLLRAEEYERMKAALEGEPPSPQERLFQFREFGRRAGWDDPEMDVYNDLDPRRPS